eukprot:scaffold38524_cov33-Tisochrysis_lutea.AAC.2
MGASGPRPSTAAPSGQRIGGGIVACVASSPSQPTYPPIFADMISPATHPVQALRLPPLRPSCGVSSWSSSPHSYRRYPMWRTRRRAQRVQTTGHQLHVSLESPPDPPVSTGHGMDHDMDRAGKHCHLPSPHFGSQSCDSNTYGSGCRAAIRLQWLHACRVGRRGLESAERSSHSRDIQVRRQHPLFVRQALLHSGHNPFFSCSRRCDAGALAACGRGPRRRIRDSVLVQAEGGNKRRIGPPLIAMVWGA